MKKVSFAVSTLLILILSVLLFSCQKDISSESGQTNVIIADLSTKLSTSVSGFVTDENDFPVQNANVAAGSQTTTTDQFGFFEIKNEMLPKNAAFVTIDKPGYFKGIKTWMINQNHPVFFRIKLLQKTNAGTVSGSTGGDITLSSGLKISFPAAAFVNAASGAAYTGTVTVKAQWLDPTGSDLNKNMPGDLRGINSGGEIKLLTTYSISATELTGSGGESLQIAPGKKATISMPIPASLSATAPATISLWYFNELNGLWKEDGVAVKTGNNYMGDVSHFTYWACYVSGPFINLSGRLTNPNGQDFNEFVVIIQDPLSGNDFSIGFPDEQGFFSGPVPANANLDMELFDYNLCNNLLYSMNITGQSADLNLGNLIINTTGSGWAHITGSVTDCSGLPVSAGYIFVGETVNYFSFRYSLNSNGTFDILKPLCTPTETDMVVAENSADLQRSQTSSLIISSGNNSFGTIQACGNTAAEFLNYTYNGAAFHFSTPGDYISHGGSPNYNTIYTYSPVIGNFINMAYDGTNIAAGSLQNIIGGFRCNASPDSLVADPGSKIHISEYGNIGQHLAGDFSITGYKYTDPSVHFTLSCNFRAVRSY